MSRRDEHEARYEMQLRTASDQSDLESPTVVIVDYDYD